MIHASSEHRASVVMLEGKQPLAAPHRLSTDCQHLVSVHAIELQVAILGQMLGYRFRTCSIRV